MADEKSKNPTTSSPEKRRSTVPDIRPQNSFEKRYSSIINDQILVNNINTEEIRRQMQVFLPSSRTSSPNSKIEELKMEGDEKDEDE